jgi:hypothetical protein
MLESMLMQQDNNNRIGGVLIRVLASRAVDREFEPRQLKPKTIKLVFAAFSLSTLH